MWPRGAKEILRNDFLLLNNPKSGLLLAALIFAVAFALRSVEIFLEPPWLDEMATLDRIQEPWRNIPDRLSRDFHHPPLLNLLLRMAFPRPQSVAHLRLLSLAASMAAMLFVFLTARRFLDPVFAGPVEARKKAGRLTMARPISFATRPSFVALSIMAFSAVHIHYAAEARHTMLFSAINGAALLFLLSALFTGRLLHWGLFSLAQALGAAAQHFGIVTMIAYPVSVAAVALCLPGRDKDKMERPIRLREVVATIVSQLPALLVLTICLKLSWSGRQTQGFTPPWIAAPSLIDALDAAFFAPLVLKEHWPASAWASLRAALVLAASAWAILILTIGLGASRLNRQNPERLRLLALIALPGLLLLGVVWTCSYIKPVFQPPKQAVVWQPNLAMILGVAVSGMWRKNDGVKWRWLIAAALSSGLVLMLCLGTYKTLRRQDRSHFASFLNIVDSRYDPSRDALLIYPFSTDSRRIGQLRDSRTLISVEHIRHGAIPLAVTRLWIIQYFTLGPSPDPWREFLRSEIRETARNVETLVEDQDMSSLALLEEVDFEALRQEAKTLPPPHLLLFDLEAENDPD